MKSIPITVGAFEAKTHLAELLRKVSAGQVVRITQRGKPVADLMPITDESMELTAIAAQKMLTLMKGVAVQGNIDIKSLINVGRD
jgi:prevent-host-death family protein